MKSLAGYFPGLTQEQSEQFSAMPAIYHDWNTRINVISRKDIGFFEVRHLLHSLSIARHFTFAPGTRLMDAGTGGGFPGIPLAVMFPQCEFVLVDSIGKKIRVVEAAADALGLKNVTTRNIRYEDLPDTFDFITGRAVTNLAAFSSALMKKTAPRSRNATPNGILYLTGGETAGIIGALPFKAREFSLSEDFDDPWFATKKLIHLYRP